MIHRRRGVWRFKDLGSATEHRGWSALHAFLAGSFWDVNLALAGYKRRRRRRKKYGTASTLPRDTGICAAHQQALQSDTRSANRPSSKQSQPAAGRRSATERLRPLTIYEQRSLRVRLQMAGCNWLVSNCNTQFLERGGNLNGFRLVLYFSGKFSLVMMSAESLACMTD